tara:strand:- start:10617 stop:11579 length:963 start_codon:yes stop_codon:yes gene_type:complete
MSILKENRVLLAKLETTVGTPISLADADGVFCAYDVEINPNIDFQQRDQQGGMSQLEGKTGAETCQLTFKLGLTGDGSSGKPTWAETFLPACGLVNKTGNVYSPSSKGVGVTGGGSTSATPRSLTMAVYEGNDGIVKQLFGATGNVKFIFAAGQIAAAEFTFMGVWSDVANNTSLPAPNYPPQLPLSVLGATMTVGGASVPCWNALSIDTGNSVVMRPCATATKGVFSSIITSRRVVGAFDPEASKTTVYDPYNNWTDGDTDAVSLALTDSTDTITFAIPVMQITSVGESDRNGIVAEQIAFQACAASDAGDDELSITFS